MDSVPFTERRNALTMNIDAETPAGIVDLLHKCNLQVFDGYENHKGLFDEEFLNKLNQLIPVVQSVLQKDKSAIIISGCGTSGRIGFLACTFFNQLCNESNIASKYRYIIAGGNSALVSSIEAIEDDPCEGEAALRQVADAFEHVLFIGVTCGLSAPFVGGQLDYCLDNPNKFTPVLIGFNTVAMARRTRLAKWPNNRTFHDVASRMETTAEAFVLNPIIGPEPISGSSRMKGGTATKIMLDTVFLLANGNVTPAKPVIDEFRATVDRMTNVNQDLATLVQRAGECLLKNACIRYIGSSTFGIWSMIDASECVPTYNSDYNDIRGLMTNDYFRKNLNPESIHSSTSAVLQESTPDDMSKTIANLPPSSLVIFIDKEYHSQSAIVDQLRTKGHYIVWIKLLSTESVTTDPSVQILDLSQCLVSSDTNVRHCLAETILKLSLNTISTGAHIIKGKVYQNMMIDVRVSNIKLFYRAIDIIKMLTRVDQQTAERCLVQSIYQTDEAVNDKTVEQHISAVPHNRDHIVPIALLMGLSGCSYLQAKRNIDQCPKIRDICVGGFEQKLT